MISVTGPALRGLLLAMAFVASLATCWSAEARQFRVLLSGTFPATGDRSSYSMESLVRLMDDGTVTYTVAGNPFKATLNGGKTFNPVEPLSVTCNGRTIGTQPAGWLLSATERGSVIDVQLERDLAIDPCKDGKVNRVHYLEKLSLTVTKTDCQFSYSLHSTSEVDGKSQSLNVVTKGECRTAMYRD